VSERKARDQRHGGPDRATGSDPLAGAIEGAGSSTPPTPAGRDLTEHLVESTTVFAGRLLDVRLDTVRLPNGAMATREHILHPGAVMVVPVLDSGELVMERQYRYPLQQDFIEFPAGKRDAGEDPFTTAQRELREEAGFVAGSWEHLGGIHVAIAYSNERIDLYLARQLQHVGANLDDDEFLDILHVPLERALAWMGEGRITDAKTVVGLLMLEKRLRGGA
jgi:ADP-ribose pyrophosphatase